MNSLKRRLRLSLEVLEPRHLLTGFDVVQIAREEFLRIETGIAINDVGEIGFVAATSEGSAVYLATGAQDFSRLSFPPTPNRDFGVAAAINDRSSVNTETQVAARDRINGEFLLRRWDGRANQEFVTIANTFDGPPIGDIAGYDAIGSFLDINDLNQVVYVGLDTDFGTVQKLDVRTKFGETAEIGSFPLFFNLPDGTTRSAALRPQISNTSEVVFQTSSGNAIAKTELCIDQGNCSFSRIAGSPEGFDTVGRSPGISDDGTVIAFYGRDAAGPGIFLSVLRTFGDRDRRTAGSSGLQDRDIIRIAGLEGELGEGLKINSFDAESRVGVAGTRTGSSRVVIGGKLVPKDEAGSTATYFVTYLAENPETNSQALYWQAVLLRTEAPVSPEPTGGITVLEIGRPEVIAEVGRKLSVAQSPQQQANEVTINALAIHDPIANNGQVAFWAEVDGKSTVFRATPSPKSVLTVLTHGFGRNLSDPILGFDGVFGTEFLDSIYSLQRTVENLPAAGSRLDGDVATYVANWNSSEGWLQGLASFVVSTLSAAAANVQTNPVAKAALELQAELLNDLGALQVVEAGRIAEAAARQIVDDLINSGKLASPDETVNGNQVVHLIGHSRGAAVNARVSQLLAQRGYFINQYTSLDGYSTDWPGGSGFLGDIDIAGTLRQIDGTPEGGGINRRVNLLVETGLERQIDQALFPLMQIAALRFLGVNPAGFGPQVYELLFSQNRDWRAPSRTEMSNFMILSNPLIADNAPSNHLNIVELYNHSVELLGDDALALQNYLGEHRCDGIATCPPPTAEGEGSGNATTQFIDGGFENAGRLARRIADAAFAEIGDPLIDGWLAYARDPRSTLAASWDFAGDARLESQTDLGSFVRLTSQEGVAEISQHITLGANTSQLTFNLTVESANQNDIVQVIFNGEVLSSVQLSTAESPRQTVDINEIAGRSGRLSIRLVPAAESTANLTLDNLSILPSNSAPWQNPVNNLDVNGDGTVHPIDALIVINWLNRNSGRSLGDRDANSNEPYYDTNGDGVVTPIDALRVINALNRGNLNREGEFAIYGPHELNVTKLQRISADLQLLASIQLRTELFQE